MPGDERPIVFLGPSLPVEEARRIVDADFRLPVRRGDIELLSPGSVIGIIDGVFDQHQSVSPTEIRNAILQGSVILGASSMGALRASEIEEMLGVGRIYQLYAQGILEDDDEVALAFDPGTGRALSEPMVNVRHAVERLVVPGTIDAEIGRRIVQAAKRLFYPDRIYPNILRAAGLHELPDAPSLTAMLRSYDLKREDAVTLLERLRDVRRPAPARAGTLRESYGPLFSDPVSELRPRDRMPAEAPVFFWEYGDQVPFADLLTFLKLTGRFEALALRAAGRMQLRGASLPGDAPGLPDADAMARRALASTRLRWGWLAAEEARVTLGELGIGTDELPEIIEADVLARRALMLLAQRPPEELLRALRAELFLDELGLKREALRLGSLRHFARRGREQGAPSPEELERARRKLCELLDAEGWSEYLEAANAWGVSEGEASGVAEELACARRGALPVLEAMAGRAPTARPTRRSRRRTGVEVVVSRQPKLPDDGRFCTPLRTAHGYAQRLRGVVGITRVGMITSLDPMGIPNAQAFRPSGTWSSTIGSGKSTTALGAKVGAVMEEVEKWAQERFPDPSRLREVSGTYAQLRRRGRTLDPALIDLPYDTCYRPELSLGWMQAFDLLADEPIWVPTATLSRQRQPNDILYSARRGGRVFSTNGLASAFTLEESLTHSLCEVIERHTVRLAEIDLGNPGTGTPPPFSFVDLDTAPESTRGLVRKIRRAEREVRVLDLTADVRVPVFFANILTELRRPSAAAPGARIAAFTGVASHPDPEVALNAAILEASQSLLTQVAGAREDLTLRARSLGRHERTAALTRAGYAFLRGMDPPMKPFAEIRGFLSRDAGADVRWLLDRLRDAGVPHVIAADLSVDVLRPARVVKTLIPGLSDLQPLGTGPRARTLLLRDLLPRPTVRGRGQ